MLRSYLKNSLIYAVARLGTIATGLITIPILTTKLSPAEYGRFDLLGLCIILLNFIVALEISQAIARFLGDVPTQKEKSEYASTALLFSLGMYGIAAVVIVAMAPWISILLFKSPDYRQYVLFLIPWLIGTGLNYFILSQLKWENRPIYNTLLSLGTSTFTLIFIYYFLGIKELGLTGALSAYCLGLFVMIPIGLTVLMRSRSIGPVFSGIKLKEMLLFSVPLIPSSIGVFVQNYVDRLMISRLLSMEALGIYSVSFKVASLLALVNYAFQSSISPLIYEKFREADAPKKIADALNIFLFCMFSLGTALYLFVPELFLLFIGQDFFDAYRYIPLLMGSIIFSGAYVFAPGLWIQKKTSQITLINIAGTVINLSLNFVLITRYGVWGAACATVISMGIMSCINYLISQREYRIPFNWAKLIWAGCVFGMVLTAIGQTLSFEIAALDVWEIASKLFYLCIGILIFGGILLYDLAYPMLRSRLKRFFP